MRPAILQARSVRPAAGALPGALAALGAATIWGGAIAMTRLGVGAEAAALEPADVALLRFLLPALLLAPLAMRTLRQMPRALRPRLLLVIAGGGTPFVLLAGSGLREAGAADAGALLPGAVPLWVALVSMGAARGLDAGVAAMRRIGLALILLALLLLIGPSVAAADSPWPCLVLLAASLLSALYTVGLARCGLAPLQAAAVVSLVSIPLLLPAYAIGGRTGLAEAGPAAILVQIGWQGMLSGLVAPLAFAAAVARLGPSRAAAYAALCPAMAALWGVILLGEVPEPVPLAALAVVCLGGLLAAQDRPSAHRAPGPKGAPPADSSIRARAAH